MIPSKQACGRTGEYLAHSQGMQPSRARYTAVRTVSPPAPILRPRPSSRQEKWPVARRIAASACSAVSAHSVSSGAARQARSTSSADGGVGTIDRGLLSDDTIASRHPVPAPSNVGSPNDPRRLRAGLVSVLRAAAVSGDTLLL